MMTEIYFEKELSDVAFDIEVMADWKRIAEELKLEGQISLTSHSKTPVPYPYMNTVMQRVYETLCPQKDDFKKFSKSPIPFDVLKQIAYSVSENHFQKIEIWSDTKAPDPLAIGIICDFYVYDRGYSRKFSGIKSREEAESLKKEHDLYGIGEENEQRYVIARWGDELCSFVELKQRAIKRFMESMDIELRKKIANATAKLNTLKENTAAYFDGTITKYDFEHGTSDSLPF